MLKIGTNPTWFKWDGESANFFAKVDGKDVKFTWHHHQDGKSMFPVPTSIHNSNKGGFSHSGGATILKNGLEGLFDPPRLKLTGKLKID